MGERDEPFQMPSWWPRARDHRFIVGIDLSVWFFPEFDQWKLGFRKRDYPEPQDYYWAIGPLRVRFNPATIDRPTRPTTHKGER